MSLKQKAINAVKWNAIARFSDYFIQFTLGVILARLLSPEIFGIIALITVITELSNVFIEGGFNASLIQNKNVEDIDYSTIFYVNITIGFIFTVIIYFAAPLLCQFYNDYRLLNPTKVLSFVYLINSFSVVQRAYLSRKVDFKKLSIIQIFTVSCSGIFGIILAYSGYSYWTLVWKRIFAVSLSAIMIYFLSDLRPKLLFSYNVLKKHWKFSSSVFMATLISNISQKFDHILVGRFFSAYELGLFSRAKNYAYLPVNFSSSTISQSFFPILSSIQADKTEFARYYIKIYRMVTLIILPILLLLMLNAKEFILLLIGNKWIGMALYLQLFCISGILYIMNSIKYVSLSSLGHPKYGARINMINGPFYLIIITLVAIYFDSSPLLFIIIGIFFSLYSFFYSSFHLKNVLDTKMCTIMFSNYREILISIVSILFAIIIKIVIPTEHEIISLISNIIIFIIIYIILLGKYNYENKTELIKTIYNVFNINILKRFD